MAEGSKKQRSDLTLSIALAKDGGRSFYQSVKKERLQTLRSNITVEDLFFKIEDEEDEIVFDKKKKMKLAQKFVLYSMNIVSRWLSLTDLVTDGILFYRATQYGKALPLTIGLFTSMIAPYILSYSSGVKLFLFRGTFKELQGFYRILLLLFLFPTGVLYFVFLDILDIILNIFRWLASIIFRWNELKIKQLEEVLALQVGMDRMNWEGFKRQKTVAQLMFETFPQITIQVLLYTETIPGAHLTGITGDILLISITSAILNCVRQIIKLVLESKAVNQNVIEYSLHCVMARVGWLPFRTTIDTYRIMNQIESNPEPLSIDYNIKYNIPIISKCCGIQGSMEYDFSTRTIHHLVAALSMVEGKKKKKQIIVTKKDTNEEEDEDTISEKKEDKELLVDKNEDAYEESEDEYDDYEDDERLLSIKFGKTLRLLTLQDLLLVLSVCQKQNIEILDIIEPKVFDFGTAIIMSKKMDKDCRLLQHARNAQGKPLLMAFGDLALKPARIQSRMMFKLLQHELDVNITDLTTGESLIFSLLRNYDYSTIRYLLTRYSEEKKIKINLNYYNKNGISPLYVALQSYNYEKRIKGSKRRRFMYDYLMSYGAPLNASIRENTQLSPLWFAIHDIDDKKLTQTLIQRGCELNIEEVNKLSQLYCDFAIRDNKHIYVTANKKMNQKESDEELKEKQKEAEEVKEEHNGSEIDLSDPKFDKYKKMKKLNIPWNRVIHNMKLNRFTDDEIDAFKLFINKEYNLNEADDEKELNLNEADDEKELKEEDANKRIDADDKKEEDPNKRIVKQQMETIAKLRYAFFKYRIHCIHNDDDDDDDKNTFAFASNLASIYSVIQKCKIPQSYICDDNKDNPLHLYIKSAIQNGTYDMNVIKLLKLECHNWLYLDNNDGKTPIDLCIEARNVQLFESLMFDKKHDRKLYDYKTKIQSADDAIDAMNDEKDAKEDEEEKETLEMDKEDEPILILNEPLYRRTLSRFHHIDKYNMLLTWIVDVTHNLLTPYLKNVSPHLLDIMDHNTEVTILDCNVASKQLKHYMESNDKSRINSLNTLFMLLQCIKSDSDMLPNAKSLLVTLCAKQYKLYIIDVLMYHFNLRLGNEDKIMLESYTKQCKAARANEKDEILRILNKEFEMKSDVYIDAEDTSTIATDEKETHEDEDMDDVKVNKEEDETKEVTNDETANGDLMDDEKKEESESVIEDKKEHEIQVTSAVDDLLMAADKIDEDENEEANASSWVELIYSTFVESLSMADFITDFLVLRQLFDGGHQWWSSWMVLMMLSSYLVSFSVVGTLFVNAVSSFVQKRKLTKQSKCSCQWFLFVLSTIILMTPLSVLYFFIVDVVFMVYVLVSTLIYVMTCAHVDITDFIDDYLFQKLLGMNRMQIIGYRRLRTLSQLLFESIPQLLLQVHMLRVSNLDGLDANSLIMSILFALLHMMFEGIIIYSDSKACDSSILEYGLQCLHARMNWIPYGGVFEMRLKQQIKAIEKEDDLTYDKTKHYYQFNYENLIANVCGLKYKLEFKFDNDSISLLTENLISLPMPSILKDSSNVDNPMLRLILCFKNREDSMIHILFGNDCCRNINLSSFCDTYRNGYKKVIFSTNDIDWERMIKKKTNANRKFLNELAIYAELDAVNVLLQPQYELNKTPQYIKNMILKLMDDDNSDSLLILKKYSDKRVYFGYNCTEAQIIYNAIYNILLNIAPNDPSYYHVILFYLWYTQQTIYNHHCLNGCCHLVDYLARYNNDEVNEMIDNVLHGVYVPKYLKIDAYDISFQLLEAFGIYKDKLEKCLMNQCAKPLSSATESGTIESSTDEGLDSFDDISKIDIDFLEMLVRCDPGAIKRGLPKHKEFETLFTRLDPIVVKWNMHPSYYYLYLLASQPLRKLTKTTVEFNEGIDINTDQSDTIVTKRYLISSQIMLDATNASDILGIKDICVSFEKLSIEKIVKDDAEHKEKEAVPKSQDSGDELCEFKVILNIPIMNSNNDNIQWNEVELIPSRLLGYTSKDTDAVIQCNINEHFGFGAFNPCLYNLKDLQVEYIFICPPKHQLKCANLNIEFTYFTDEFESVDHNANEAVLATAISTSNEPLLDFVLSHTNMFDVNATNKEGQNAIHVVCEQDSRAITSFKSLITKLVASGVEINATNLYGYTPVDLITDFHKKRLMMHEFNAVPTIKSGMGSSQSVFSQCNDKIIENIFSFLDIKSQKHLKSTCHPMRNIIQQSSICAMVTLLPYVQQTQNVDFQDVMQMIPLYDKKCYNQMTLYCNSQLFQSYCRLMSYHWHLIWTERGRLGRAKDTSAGLAHLYPHKNMELFVTREINEDSMELFSMNPLQKYRHNMNPHDASTLIWDKKTFMFLLNEKFYLNKWKDIVFNSKQHLLIGGSVCSALIKFIDKEWQRTKENERQDLDFAMLQTTVETARYRVNNMRKAFSDRGIPALVCDGGTKNVLNLVVNFTRNKSNIVKSKKGKNSKASTLAGKDIIEKEPFLTLFEFIVIGGLCDTWSFLHQIDLDCSQVGFDGQDVVSTYAFVQSITTQTIIDYSLVNDYWAMQRTNAIERINKYHDRGFTLLAPKEFDFKHLDRSLSLNVPMDNSELEKLKQKRKDDINMMRDHYKKAFWKREQRQRIEPKVFEEPKQSRSKWDYHGGSYGARGYYLRKKPSHSNWSSTSGGYGTRYWRFYQYRGKDKDENTFLIETISGMTNNDSMRIMDLFLSLMEQHLAIVAAKDAAADDATVAVHAYKGTIELDVNLINQNAITAFTITKKVNRYQAETLQSADDLNKNQVNNMQLNALMMAPKRKIFISIRDITDMKARDKSDNKRLNVLQMSSLCTLYTAFSYRTAYYYKMEKKVTKFLQQSDGFKDENSIHRRAVEEEMKLIKPLFSISALTEFLNEMIAERKELQEMFTKYDEGHTKILNQMEDKLKQNGISESIGSQDLVNEFLTDYNQLFSVQNELIPVYRKWLIDLCTKLLEKQILCCGSSDFNAKTGKYKKGIITKKQSQQSAWKYKINEEEESDDDENEIDLSDPKFDKYKKMIQVYVPMKSVLQKMQMDRRKKEEIDAFSKWQKKDIHEEISRVAKKMEKRRQPQEVKKNKNISKYSKQIKNGKTFWISKKDDRRTFMKVFYESDFDPQKITDILRASLVFNNFEDLYNAIIVINEFCSERNTTKTQNGQNGILGFRNWFKTSMLSGWRQIIVNFHLSDEIPVLCELQLHFAPFWELKQSMHDKYKVYRLFNVRDTSNKRYNAVYEYMRGRV